MADQLSATGLETLGGADLEDIARLDLGRAQRRGYPEAIFCEGKTAEQVARIATALADQPQVALFTRVRSEHVAAITAVLDDAAYDADARLVAWPPSPPATSVARPIWWSTWASPGSIGSSGNCLGCGPRRRS